jgi:hypothetical protein
MFDLHPSTAMGYAGSALDILQATLEDQPPT